MHAVFRLFTAPSENCAGRVGGGVLKRLTAVLQVLTAVPQVRGVRVLNCPPQLSRLNHGTTHLKVALNPAAQKLKLP